jgi:hypothetical protein
MNRYKCILAGLLLALPAISKAQFLGGFFNQKGTERKYMIQQIALYQVYLGYAKKGYKIAQGGLETIRDIRNGELRLHDAHYDSLAIPAAAIKHSGGVRSVVRYCEYAARLVETARHYAFGSKSFSRSELVYIRRVTDAVSLDLSRITEGLDLTLTSGTARMTDDERITRIDKLRQEAASAYAFMRRFTADMQASEKNRSILRQETETTKRLYQLP